MNADDAKKLSYDEMARRYANYKHWKEAPLAGWFRNANERDDRIDKLQKQFDDAVEQRMERLTANELMHNVARSESSEEKRKYAKIIARRMGMEPGKNSKNPGDDWYYDVYQKRMQYDDIQEDLMLNQKIKDLHKSYQEGFEEAARKSAVDQNEYVRANKDWKERLDDAEKEAERRLEWIRGGKWDTPSGKKGSSKKATLLYPGQKQLDYSDDKANEAIMKNIRKWRKEALEILMRAENQ